MQSKRLLKEVRPIKGWRAFWGEVGIIVLGVLIALGAQQIVEAIHWRSEVAGFRDAVRDELSDNLGTYPYRAKQKACINARLDELQLWLESWRAGRPLKLTGPIGIPISHVIRTSVWESRDPDTVAHMPRAEKLEYGFLYSEFANNEVHRLDERDAWMELASFDGTNELDHQDMMTLQGLIYRARLRDKRIDSNAARFMKRAARIGLKPEAAPDPAPYEPELCRSILPPESKGGG